MKKSKKIKVLKILLLVLVIAIITGLLIYLIPIMKNISTSEGKLAFKEKIENLGFLGILMLFGIQIAQIFLAFLPGEPIEILAGMCYGGIGGTIFILSSVFFITTLIVILVKKFKKRFLYEFCSKEKIDKIENSKIFKNPKKAQELMMILFLIPGTPKDLLVYIGGLLPISKWRFICISTFLRFPSVVSSTFAGEKLIEGNWKFTLIMYVITFLITAIVIIIMNIFDKNKTTKNALDTLK